MPAGDNIRKRRLELRMSQQDLADAMGYKTRSTVAKIESGENDVSQKKLQRFAAVLNTTVEALIAGNSAAPAPEATPILSDEGRIGAVAVILAGGSSGENRQNIPSQFVNVHGKPLLVYSMDAYQNHPAVDAIYVVCLKGWESIVKAYAEQYGITKLKGLIGAGSSGILSLKNAWKYVKSQYPPETPVFIQEATRPLVTTETLSQLLQLCAEKESATICHPMKEYVQFDLSGGSARYTDRNAMIALQSPELHRLRRLSDVFETAQRQQRPLTQSCCTMLLYDMGYEINFLKSSINNIKITREEDIAAFSALVMP